MSAPSIEWHPPLQPSLPPTLPPSSQPDAVYRILDANLDRAREGLRIVEEWCRFGLEDAQLTETCKQMRQELGGWHDDRLREARDTPGDPGTALTHPQEATRDTIEQVLQANLCRIQEALRVLEEYGKLYDRQLGAACKQMRYQVYALESTLLFSQRHRQLQQSRLYLVTSGSDRLLEIVEAALQGGLTLVQLRDKSVNDAATIQTAIRLRELCHRYQALFLMNDRVDLAIAADADGVHLGQQDVPIALARQLLGDRKIIGRSTTNPAEMQQAIAEGADYIGVGPVYETPTKAGKAAAGLEYVRYAEQHATVPWFAIGGIDLANVTDVLKAGADRVAVVRALMAAEQPTLAVQYLLAQIELKARMKGLANS
jgi:thiamine-phosphate pyrophosphorylase